jgi:hypothetical protein
MKCSLLCSLFDGKTLHVSSVTRSSSVVQETVFAARCRIQLFLILSYVLHLCKVLWVLDWCAMVVLLVVCTVSCGVIHYLHCVDVGH